MRACPTAAVRIRNGKAFKLADRCIDCGECENACPMDIPLRLIKKIMRDEVRTRFGYDAGADATDVSPFATVQTGGTSDAVC